MSKRFVFWPHITHVIVLTFKEIKHLSDYRTAGPSDYRSDHDFFLHVQFRPNFHFVGVLKLFVLSVLVLGTQLFLKVRLIF